jgi:hypothetical protein
MAGKNSPNRGAGKLNINGEVFDVSYTFVDAEGGRLTFRGQGRAQQFMTRRMQNQEATLTPSDGMALRITINDKDKDDTLAGQHSFILPLHGAR